MGCAIVLLLSVVGIGTAFIWEGWFRVLYATPVVAFVAWGWWRSLGKHPWQRLRAKFGWGKGIEELARRMGVEPDVILSHQPTYREATIPKRRGGIRTLQVPDSATKELQQKVLHRLLSKLQVHPAAHAFEPGKSIVTNARPHVGQSVVVKLDVIDFFPTTQVRRLERYFREVGWNRQAAAVLVKLLTWQAGLPQGAPTSPKLSNLLNWWIDERITRWVTAYRGTYTRYADDITISFSEDWPSKVRGTILRVRRYFAAAGYRLHGKAKGGIFRHHRRQEVTGLVVNDEVGVGRSRRRWLRAVEHRLAQGRPATLTAEQLAGWKAYLAMVEAQRGDPPPRRRGKGSRGPYRGRRNGAPSPKPKVPSTP